MTDRRHLLMAALLATTIMAIATVNLAKAGSLIDCPLRDEIYSVDSPLMDVLLKAEARAVLESEAPAMLDGLPPRLLSTESPAFGAIVTPRTLATRNRMAPEIVTSVDRRLRSLAITDADRKARCARYNNEVPEISLPENKLRVLVFEKITGYHHGPAVAAATAALQGMAERNGWALAVTDKGGAMTPGILEHIDVVIWNNVSGDVLTLSQRRVFKDYIHRGGGYVGIHAPAGDPDAFWDWYADELLGARFAGHTYNPQFQEARIEIDVLGSLGHGLPRHFTLRDEWYSFESHPRDSGAQVVATIAEFAEPPMDPWGRDLRMVDHPIAWARCVGDGRAFYSGIGHLPENYEEPSHVSLLEQAIHWAAGQGDGPCPRDEPGE